MGLEKAILQALEEVRKVGRAKYGSNHWEEDVSDVPTERNVASMERHLAKFKAGHIMDEEYPDMHHISALIYRAGMEYMRIIQEESVVIVDKFSRSFINLSYLDPTLSEKNGVDTYISKVGIKGIQDGEELLLLEVVDPSTYSTLEDAWQAALKIGRSVLTYEETKNIYNDRLEAKKLFMRTIND